MTLSDQTLAILSVAALALSVLAVASVIFGSRSRRRLDDDSMLGPEERIERLMESQGKAIQRLEAAVRQLAGGQRVIGELLEGTVQHVGVVRFDAFEDMGGRLSFSAALLDGHGDGVVITSINGRQDTRCYAKPVRGGTSIHNLSDEEEQAIRDAMSAPRQTAEAS